MILQIIGLLSGTLIGWGFGMIQNYAWRRHERLQQSGKLTSGWAVMPGSMRRVAYLLVALAGVQIVCPLLFSGSTQWWVSGGVVAGYGYILARQLQLRLSPQK